MSSAIQTLRRSQVGRPAPPAVPSGVLEFQVIDVVEINAPPIPQTNIAASTAGGSDGKKPCNATYYLLFGVDREGLSVSALIPDYRHYLYCGVDTRLDPAELQAALTKHLHAVYPDTGKHPAVLHVSLLPSEYRSIYAFARQKRFIYRVTFRERALYAPIRGFFLDTATLAQHGVHIMGGFRLFEADLDTRVRFMVDTGIVGCGWVRLPEYTLLSSPRAPEVPPSLRSTTQVQVLASAGAIAVPDHSTPEYTSNAPLRILSFDIECASFKGGFPDAKTDPIINISMILYIQNVSTAERPAARISLALRSCAPVQGALVFSYDSEAALLQDFAEMVALLDPDLITGYNIDNFDFVYVYERAALLGVQCGGQCGGRPFAGRMSRLEHFETTVVPSRFQSKQLGQRESYEVTIPGRVSVDMLPIVQQQFRLRSYTLNFVCTEFLKEQKEDVHYSLITPLFEGDQFTRRKLAVYCLKDAYLPIRLIEKLMVVFQYAEMAKVSGVPLSYLLSSGQQIKMLSLLYRNCRETKLLIPYRAKAGAAQVRETEDGEEVDLEGATVLEPLRGYYSETQPVATLDFSSLYPSIIIAHNLCYSTLVQGDDLDVGYYNMMVAAGSGGAGAPGRIAEDQTETPVGCRFFKRRVREGLLPMILRNLLQARKQAKRDMKAARDDLTRAVLDGRQLALKITANSLYGFTGSMTTGKLPSMEISSSVTAFGRQMIEFTKGSVERRFATGQPDISFAMYEHGAGAGVGTNADAGASPVPKVYTNVTEEPFVRLAVDPLYGSFDKLLETCGTLYRARDSLRPHVVPADPAASDAPTPTLTLATTLANITLRLSFTPREHALSAVALVYSLVHDAVVVYGDTDSVMVRFGVDNVPESMLLAKFAAAYVTSSFLPPISLEFEKVYCPYLLINKKRYAGLYWTNTAKYDKIDIKGLELVRRDNCLLVVIMMKRVLELLLVQHDPAGAVRYVKAVVQDLLSGRVDMGLLVISKSLTQPIESYKNINQPHVALAVKLHQRDRNHPPKVGNRIQYVVVASGDRNSKVYERAEDPRFVIENSLSVDTDYYLHQQIEKPISRLFRDILRVATEEDAADILFKGAHAMVASSSRVADAPARASGMAGGIFGLIKVAKAAKCKNCNVRIGDDMGEVYSRVCLCKACLIEHGPAVYNTLARTLALAEHRYARVASECQYCTSEFSKVADLEDNLPGAGGESPADGLNSPSSGLSPRPERSPFKKTAGGPASSRSSDAIMCSSTDCSIYYARVKVEKDLRDAQGAFAALQAFTWY